VTENTRITSPYSIYPDREDFLDLGMSETGPLKALLWVEEPSERAAAGIFLSPEELRALAEKALELAEDIEDTETAARLHDSYVAGGGKSRPLSELQKELDL
jgi:hypothetical protein